MTNPTTNAPITLDDLRTVRGHEDYRHFEIENGAWVRKHEPGKYDEICDRYAFQLTALLARFAETLPSGVVYSGDTTFVLDQDTDQVQTMRRPDVAFLTDDAGLTAKDIQTRAPDLAIDIVAPSDTPGVIRRRLADYFSHGAQQVWLVYPDVREVVQHLPNGMAYRHGMGLTVMCNDLLPGFRLDVTSVFAKE